uniref:Uncharacterized protein n=1 Tax=Timema genevievae TaxID=629358 RepID=A0A7R9JX33_TIMGE|nr:unnamed protein product [Timema genevievae]
MTGSICSTPVPVQEEMVAQLTRDRAEQLKVLSSQLILFESRLCRKQKHISVLLSQRETIIFRQQRLIQALQGRLMDAGLDCSLTESPPGGDETNLDSLNDSDSAVVMEEGLAGDGDILPRFRSGMDSVTVIRSVSDAVEPSNNKYSSLRRSNGFLRRPEILETVYSVEEDGEGEVGGSNTSPSNNHKTETGDGGEDPMHRTKLQALYGSFERLNESPPERRDPDHAQVTYNRVMSNHRSVTKPKDVKYKRINKAKSKSLEELRGRLRNWVDKGGNKLALSLDQSYA